MVGGAKWEACQDVTHKVVVQTCGRSHGEITCFDKEFERADEICVDFDTQPTETLAEERLRAEREKKYRSIVTTGKVDIHKTLATRFMETLGNIFKEYAKRSAEMSGACAASHGIACPP